MCVLWLHLHAGLLKEADERAVAAHGVPRHRLLASNRQLRLHNARQLLRDVIEHIVILCPLRLRGVDIEASA